MKWHCGVLDEDPTKNRAWRWIARGGWTKPSFPEDVRYELSIWLAMPGFSDQYNAHNLHVARDTLKKYRRDLPGYEDLKAEVAENWLSVTREDAIRLCHRRKGKGNIPLISQFKMLDDLKAMSMSEVARVYGVSIILPRTLRDQGVSLGKFNLPEGFASTLLTYRS